MKNYILLVSLLVLGAFQAMAQKTMADSAFQKGHYDDAVRLYEDVLQQGEHPYVYYNLGNAYYRQGDMAHAILNYERAALLEPGNSDIRFNLALARSKTIDKVADGDQFFLFYWLHSLLNLQNADGWGRCALLFFSLFLLSLLVRIFIRSGWVKTVASIGWVSCLCLALVLNIFAWMQNRQLQDKTYAIMMQTMPVRSTPAESGTALFTLHPGTKVKIIDDTMEHWKEVTLPDGKRGWVHKSSMELI